MNDAVGGNPSIATTAQAGPKPPQRAALAFIFVTVMLDVLAGSIIGPVLPKLLEDLSGGSIATMTTVFGAMMMLYAGLQLFAGPMQGALSDRFGRRPVILASNFGLAIDYVIMALAPTLTWLFIGRAITGVMAGSITAAYAYVADVTSQEKLAVRMGWLSAAISAGAMAGPLVGGLLGEIDPRAPFWAAAGLSLANGLYGLFVLPESLPADQRAPLKWGAIHPIGAVTGILKQYPVLIGWLAAMFVMSLGFMGVNSIFLLYVAFRFEWTPVTIGLYSTTILGMGLIVQGLLVGPAIRWLGERGALMTGLTVQTVAFVAAGFAGVGWMFTAAVLVMMLGNVAYAARLSMMNRIITPSDRGRLSGAGRSIESLTGLVAPGIFAAIFAWSSSLGPHHVLTGSVLFIAAALSAAGIAITAWALKRTPAWRDPGPNG